MTTAAPAETSVSEVANFKMPSIKKGDVVVIYPQGDVTSDPTPALVTNARGRSITVVTLQTKVEYTGVYHSTDPKVQINQEIRLNGTWDYTESTKENMQLKADVRELKEKVKYLGDILDAKYSNSSKKQG